MTTLVFFKSSFFFGLKKRFNFLTNTRGLVLLKCTTAQSCKAVSYRQFHATTVRSKRINFRPTYFNLAPAKGKTEIKEKGAVEISKGHASEVESTIKFIVSLSKQQKFDQVYDQLDHLRNDLSYKNTDHLAVLYEAIGENITTWNDMEDLLYRMRIEHVLASTKLYKQSMACASSSLRCDAAVELVKNLDEAGIMETSIYGLAAQICAKTDNWEDMKNILKLVMQPVKKLREEFEPPDTPFFSAIISEISKGNKDGENAAAGFLLDFLGSNRIKLSSSLYHACMLASIVSNQCTEVVELYDRMKSESGCVPSTEILVLVLDVCKTIGNDDKVKAITQELKNRNHIVSEQQLLSLKDKKYS